MWKYLLAILTAASCCAQAATNDPPSCHDEDRRIIADLDHIVAPQGIQESYKLRVGGIDQWVYVLSLIHI